jgi:hypothetical protein
MGVDGYLCNRRITAHTKERNATEKAAAIYGSQKYIPLHQTREDTHIHISVTEEPV